MLETIRSTLATCYWTVDRLAERLSRDFHCHSSRASNKYLDVLGDHLVATCRIDHYALRDQRECNQPAWIFVTDGLLLFIEPLDPVLTQ